MQMVRHKAVDWNDQLVAVALNLKYFNEFIYDIAFHKQLSSLIDATCERDPNLTNIVFA